MITVAIVEDVDDIREGLASLIETSEGVDHACSFSNAEDALEKLSKDPVDVVLMDIHLPQMDGIECVRQLKLKQPNMQFIMSTIFEDDESIFKALKVGALGYLLKKAEPTKILEAIKEIVAGGSPMSMQIARRVIESFQKPIVHDNEHLLTAREKEILNLLERGFRYKEIADQLFISTDTVRKHINNMYKKLQVQSRMDAVNKYYNR